MCLFAFCVYVSLCVCVISLFFISRRQLFVLFVCFSSMSVYADLYKPVYMKEYAIFYFRDDSFTRGQTPISVTGHWRILSYDYMFKKVYVPCLPHV